jgi:hypothetical protein
METVETLTFDAGALILAQLPDRIQQAILDRAAQINYPVEAILEMAFTKCFRRKIAGYLDSEAIGFVDCKPNRYNS